MTVNTTTGRSAFLSLLEDEGVSHLFGNPGTTELPIMDALTEHPDLTYVLGLQESIVVAMADGYARASGELTACNVHVAPGLGNAMGSLFSANWWGSPLLLTAGQQEQGHGLTEPLLYGPMLPMATPLVKWAVEATRLVNLPRIVRRAAKIATTAPTGPVFLSLPGDILNDEGAVDLGARTRVDTQTRPADAALERLADRLLAAERPLIVAGHEIATHDALAEAARVAELLGAPVYQQTIPYGAHFLSEHPCYLGALTRNQKLVREQLSPHDLLICLGADVLRMSVYSEIEPLPDEMPVIQIGLRDWEMGKNYPAEIAVRADLKETLGALVPILEARRDASRAQAADRSMAEIATRNWSSNRAALITRTLERARRRPIDPDFAMMRIVEALPRDAVVVDEALTSGANLNAFYPYRDTGSYYGLASGGIGFAIAGAIGIQLAHPDRPVVAIIGDGSAMYSVQGLWSAANMKLPIVYVICNNRSYRILKERLLAFHGNSNFVGMDFQDPPIDFAGLASSMGVESIRVTEPDDLAGALEQALANRAGPTLLDVTVHDGFEAA